jgi:hypothetical protein
VDDPGRRMRVSLPVMADDLPPHVPDLNVGTDPAGSWELEFENTLQVRNWFSAGLIQDVVLVFTLSGTTPIWA